MQEGGLASMKVWPLIVHGDLDRNHYDCAVALLLLTAPRGLKWAIASPRSCPMPISSSCINRSISKPHVGLRITDAGRADCRIPIDSDEPR